MQSPSGNLNLIFFQQLCKILPIMQPWIFFFRVFLNSNHKISRHKSSRKFPPHLTVVLIEFRSEIYDLKNTLRRRDTNQRPSTTKVQFSTMLHTLGSNQLWNSNFTGYFFQSLFEIQGRVKNDGTDGNSNCILIKKTFTLKVVSKSQKHFLLKLQYPKDKQNIWQNSVLAS